MQHDRLVVGAEGHRTRPISAGGTLIGLGIAVVLFVPSVGASALALFHGSLPANQHVLAAASFSPAVAPTITRSGLAATPVLSWAPVVLSSGATVSYTVIRIPKVGSPVEVCTGADAPVLASGVVSCTDRVHGANPNDRYTEQPYLVRSGQVTWSLAASTPSA